VRESGLNAATKSAPIERFAWFVLLQRLSDYWPTGATCTDGNRHSLVVSPPTLLRVTYFAIWPKGDKPRGRPVACRAAFAQAVRCRRRHQPRRPGPLRSGREVQRRRTPSGIIGHPVTWERNGKQYVTVSPSRRITAGKVNHHPFALASFFSKLLEPELGHTPTGFV
jgi:hypothetical protein